MALVIMKLTMTEAVGYGVTRRRLLDTPSEEWMLRLSLGDCCFVVKIKWLQQRTKISESTKPPIINQTVNSPPKLRPHIASSQSVCLPSNNVLISSLVMLCPTTTSRLCYYDVVTTKTRSSCPVVMPRHRPQSIRLALDNNDQPQHSHQRCF
jgi:hypothetical protein